MSNLLMYEWTRPHSGHLLYFRTENFGGSVALCLIAFLAILVSPFYLENGNPSSRRSAWASSSVFAVVSMETFMPRVRMTWS